jgi:hypothetical protein
MVTTRSMVRAAGVALLILNGCAVPEYFSVSYWQRDSSGQTSGIGVTRTGGSTAVTLSGSPDVVAQRFRGALAQLGMQAQIMTDGEGVRISTTTRSGNRLTIALTHEAIMGGEQTKVHMEWSGGADAQIEGDLIRLVSVGR